MRKLKPHRNLYVNLSKLPYSHLLKVNAMIAKQGMTSILKLADFNFFCPQKYIYTFRSHERFFCLGQNYATSMGISYHNLLSAHILWIESSMCCKRLKWAPSFTFYFILLKWRLISSQSSYRWCVVCWAVCNMATTAAWHVGPQDFPAGLLKRY